MSGRPRLVATDLDGTLLDADGRLTATSARVLAGLPGAGVEVLVVTARPPRWLGPIAPLGHASVICLNGALVLDVATGAALELDPIADDVVAAVVSDLRVAVPGAVFALERPTGMAAEHRFAVRPELDSGVRRAERVEDLLDGATGKLLLRCASMVDAELFDLVADALDGRAVLADSGAPGLAEIARAGVSKASALTRWVAARGIDAADVWAFGDMPNDLPMLSWAGRGVAVANAHPTVIAAADDVCGPHTDDGVARYLAPLLDGGRRSGGAPERG